MSDEEWVSVRERWLSPLGAAIVELHMETCFLLESQYLAITAVSRVSALWDSRFAHRSG